MSDKIYSEITAERAYQDKKWGGVTNDDSKSVYDWIAFIVVYLGRASGAETDWGQNIVLIRPLLVKVAALAVAAIESLDRRFSSLKEQEDE